MKKLGFLFLSIAMLAFTACTKEGPKGPAGATGPAGPAGQNANYSVNELVIVGADWAGAGYIEYEADFITQDVYEAGSVVVYVQDEFGYWNSVPSQFHPISGYGYSWTAANGGIVGFESDGTVTTDFTARVVTMDDRDFQVLQENGKINNLNDVIEYFNQK